MGNRRTARVVLAAALLAAASLGACFVRGDRLAAIEPVGWQVVLLRDGQPIKGGYVESLPANPFELYPEAVVGWPYSLNVEPASAGIALAGCRIAPADRPLVEFLLLLPPATLLVCFLRQFIGLNCYGTFAPALLGLAFRDVASVVGVFVVLSIIFAGWWLRRGLNELHLLQVPRTALMLSCVVALLLALITALSGPGPRAITLFPLVILTGMIERFWATEEEDGPGSSFAALGWTLATAGGVWLMARSTGLTQLLLAHPELLGLAMAGQLLLGRYTGLRLVELYRFRSLADGPAPSPAAGGYSLLSQARVVVRPPRKAAVR